MDKDVTAQVDFGLNDDEILPLTKCVCGAKWSMWGGPYLSIYRDTPYGCPECGRKMYFRISIRVFEVKDAE
jgi:hypothetical protein